MDGNKKEKTRGTKSLYIAITIVCYQLIYILMNKSFILLHRATINTIWLYYVCTIFLLADINASMLEFFELIYVF